MGAPQEECEECEEGAPAWMATFSDLCTLLLTFFVLLLSMANMDVRNFREMAGSVRHAFGVRWIDPGPYEAEAGNPTPLGEGGAIASGPSASRHDPNDLIQRLREAVENHNISDRVEIGETPEGIVLRVRDHALFRSGDATLQPEAFPLLGEVAAIASEMGQPLFVEGHTDDRPIRTSHFPSNWELSTARATAVLRYMIQEGMSPSELAVAGYADSRPLDSNSSDEGRSRNRRVEFLFRTDSPTQAQNIVDRMAPSQPGAHTPAVIELPGGVDVPTTPGQAPPALPTPAGPAVSPTP